jgi:hypothetical protein
MKIINHSTVIDCTPVVIRDGEHPNRVVLRRVSDKEYVVHQESMQINGNLVEHLEFYQGQYFKDYSSAVQEFNRHL